MSDAAHADLSATRFAPLPNVTLDASLSATLDATRAGLGQAALSSAAAPPRSSAAVPALDGRTHVGTSLGGTVGDRGATRDSTLPRMAEVDGTLYLTAADGPRYQALRPLGRGGMGEVELVEDRDIGRPVALKRLLPEALEPGAIARFVDEVRIIGRLEHPNIVPIHDVGVDADGRYFLVMKYIDGETIESIIDRLKAGDPEAVAHYDIQRRVQIFKGLLRALEYAHAQGYVHRDIKPANVMVGRYGEVVLMDWGVAFDARARGGAEAESGNTFNPGDTLVDGRTGADRLSSTQAGALVGTPHYMSPEQALGENHKVDARSDLYSACVMFHEMLGLKHRHAHLKTLISVLVAVHSGPLPKLAAMFEPHPSQPEGVPGEYGHLIARGLARNRDERWQSAGELIAEIDAIERGECRVQCPVTFTKRNINRASKFLDRHHLLGTVAINLGVLAFVGMLIHTVVSLFS